MIQNWFDQINFFLHTHPDGIARLVFLLRVKCWLLMAIMGYFLYLIHREQKKPTVEANTTRGHHFIA